VAEVLETGIKVVDLLVPYACGGKVRLIRGCFAASSESIVETWSIGVELKNYSLMFLTLVYLRQLAVRTFIYITMLMTLYDVPVVLLHDYCIVPYDN
jgi:energy-converting hydrogenase Eha subunit E